MLELLAEQSVLVFFVIFIIFIIIAYKLVKFLFKAFIVGLVAAMFPVVGNLFLGLDIVINLYNIIWFAGTGILLFIFYYMLKTGWKVLKIITKPIGWARGSKSKKEKKEKPEKEKETK